MLDQSVRFTTGLLVYFTVKLCFIWEALFLSFSFKNIVQEDILKSILYASYTPGPGLTDTLFSLVGVPPVS